MVSKIDARIREVMRTGAPIQKQEVAKLRTVWMFPVCNAGAAAICRYTRPMLVLSAVCPLAGASVSTMLQQEGLISVG